MCSFEQTAQFTSPLYICVSTEGRPPALHTDKQGQGRRTPCWVHQLGVLGCMLLQLRTFLLICPPCTHTTHISWFTSVSLKSTVVSCTTCWTTEKGSAAAVLNVLYLFILASIKLSLLVSPLFFTGITLKSHNLSFLVYRVVLKRINMFFLISSFHPSEGYLPERMDRKWFIFQGCVTSEWILSTH